MESENKYLYTFDGDTKPTDKLSDRTFMTAKFISRFNDGRLTHYIRVNAKDMKYSRDKYNPYYHIESDKRFCDVGARFVDGDYKVNEDGTLCWYTGIRLDDTSKKLSDIEYLKNKELEEIKELELKLESKKRLFAEKWNNKNIDDNRIKDTVHNAIFDKFIKYDGRLEDLVLRSSTTLLINSDIKRLNLIEDHRDKLDELIKDISKSYKFNILEPRTKSNKEL